MGSNVKAGKSTIPNNLFSKSRNADTVPRFCSSVPSVGIAQRVRDPYGDRRIDRVDVKNLCDSL